jgi:hypothetical protein
MTTKAQKKKAKMAMLAEISRVEAEVAKKEKITRDKNAEAATTEMVTKIDEAVNTVKIVSKKEARAAFEAFVLDLSNLETEKLKTNYILYVASASLSIELAASMLGTLPIELRSASLFNQETSGAELASILGCLIVAPNYEDLSPAFRQAKEFWTEAKGDSETSSLPVSCLTWR